MNALSNPSKPKNTRSLVRNHQLDVFVLYLERWRKRLPDDSQYNWEEEPRLTP
jgi:hypothetical protein